MSVRRPKVRSEELPTAAQNLRAEKARLPAKRPVRLEDALKIGAEPIVLYLDLTRPQVVVEAEQCLRHSCRSLLPPQRQMHT